MSNDRLPPVGPDYAAFIRGLPITWTIYMTITFRNLATRRRAHRACARAYRELRQPKYADNNPRSRVSLLLAIEPHASGSDHIHALASSVSSKTARQIERWCRSEFGIAHVEKFDPRRDPYSYLAKAEDRRGTDLRLHLPLIPVLRPCIPGLDNLALLREFAIPIHRSRIERSA